MVFRVFIVIKVHTICKGFRVEVFREKAPRAQIFVPLGLRFSLKVQ